MQNSKFPWIYIFLWWKQIYFIGSNIIDCNIREIREYRIRGCPYYWVNFKLKIQKKKNKIKTLKSDFMIFNVFLKKINEF